MKSIISLSPTHHPLENVREKRKENATIGFFPFSMVPDYLAIRKEDVIP